MTDLFSTADQLGFDSLLSDAEADNVARMFERETAHLPATLDLALPYFRELLKRNHAAMLAADVEETVRLHDEARLLARKLNDGQPGIIADDDAPGCVLSRETAASAGTVPLWGQTGSFVIEAAGLRVRIEMEGMFGIGSGWGFWPGFSAHAVDLDAPFLSATGYRSFLGVHADPAPGHTPESFTVMIVEHYVSAALKGRPLKISARYRDRA
ncbi:MAG: hypothetical protein AAFY66_15245 [Pseudomonadota bacterium]